MHCPSAQENRVSTCAGVPTQQSSILTVLCHGLHLVFLTYFSDISVNDPCFYHHGLLNSA